MKAQVAKTDDEEKKKFDDEISQIDKDLNDGERTPPLALQADHLVSISVA